MTRGGEPLLTRDRGVRSSQLTSGQPTIANVAAVQALNARHTLSGRTTYSKGFLSGDSSSALARAPGHGEERVKRAATKAAPFPGSRELSPMAVGMSPEGAVRAF